MASLKARVLRPILKKVMNFDKSLYEIRSDFQKMSKKVKMNKGTSISQVNANGVNCYRVTPYNVRHDKTIFYAHGGGYCLGMYNATKQFAVNLAEKYQMQVFIVDYRVAPEAPFPSGIEDVRNAYVWLIQSGLIGEQIVMYGESAGCGLLLNTVVYLRDNQIEMPSKVAFATPFLDATMESASVKINSDVDPYYASDKNQIVNYYVKNLDTKDPMVSPLFHEMHDLPPMIIHIAEKDMLCDDGLRLVSKLRDANNLVESKLWMGMWHVFHMQGNMIKESKEALNEIGLFFGV